MSLKDNQIEHPYTQAEKDKLAAITPGAQPQPAIASQAEAEAGTDNVKMMTALRVLQSINVNAGGGGGGEANTASNLGTGAGIFSAKVGVDLRFKSLVAGTGVTLTPSGNSITIAASPGGITNTDDLPEGATNKYFTDGRVSASPAVVANTAKVSASGSVNTHNDVNYTSPTNGQVLTWDSGTSNWVNMAAPGGSGEANTASNLGAGTGVFASKVGVDLRFKSLVAGTNVTLSNDSTTITINATGGGSGHLTQYLTFDSGNIVIKVSGTSADISAVTASKDFSMSGISRLILNRPSSVQYHSVAVTFTSGETTGRTQVNIESPEPNGASTLSTSIRPFAYRLNGTQGIAATTSTIALTGGNIVLSLTGYTGGAEQRMVALY